MVYYSIIHYLLQNTSANEIYMELYCDHKQHKWEIKSAKIINGIQNTISLCTAIHKSSALKASQQVNALMMD